MTFTREELEEIVIGSLLLALTVTVYAWFEWRGRLLPWRG